MHPEVSVHTAMWGGPWTSFWVTGWTSDGGTPVAREWPTPRRSPGNGGRRNAPSAWPPSQPLRRTSGTAVARRAGVRVPLTRYHRDGCKAVGACEGCSVGRPHCRRSRTIQTSPHCVQRRETKCSVKAAMAAAVAEHSGHRPTLRAGSAPGNWIMVSETVTQARPFWQSSGHKGGSNSRSTIRSPKICSEAHRYRARRSVPADGEDEDQEAAARPDLHGAPGRPGCPQDRSGGEPLKPSDTCSVTRRGAVGGL